MNVLKLKGKMVEKGVNAELLSNKMGINRATLYRKLNEGEKITIGDALKIKSALELTDDEARDIFFG